jgi:hypothetical protein
MTSTRPYRGDFPAPTIFMTASGEPPRLFGIHPPRPRIETVRSVDMSGSNA